MEYAEMNKTFICVHKNGMFFRVFNYGLSFDMYSVPMFSERIGKRKPLFRSKKLTIRILTP